MQANNQPYGTFRLPGVGPDAPIETTPEGGHQSAVPYRFDLLPPCALAAVARVLKHGARYGENNWTQIPPKDHLNHAMQHIAAYLAGDDQEGDVIDHAEHAACRVLMWLDTLHRARQGVGA